MQASQAEERKEVLKDFFGGREEDEVSEDLLTHLIQFEELMLKYRSAIREVTTKLEILTTSSPRIRSAIRLKISSRA